jgi:Killing trait
MAFSTAVNDQITDAVTQSGIELLGAAPAVAIGNLYIATSQALANAAHNATAAQQNNAMMAQAATKASLRWLNSLKPKWPA